MHKRNLTITAFVWAGIITVAFLIFPKLYHGAIGWCYFPAVALSVILSHIVGGNPHSPSNAVGWSAFAVYTIFYWVVFLIIYVIGLEYYLLRRVLHHLEDVKQNLTSEKPDSHKALEKMGQAIAELESRRRRHFLLQKLDLPELPENQRHLLAAHAIARAGRMRPVKVLLKKLHKELAAETSTEQASVLLGNLKNAADVLVAQPSAMKKAEGGGDSDASKQTPKA